MALLAWLNVAYGGLFVSSSDLLGNQSMNGARLAGQQGQVRLRPAAPEVKTTRAPTGQRQHFIAAGYGGFEETTLTGPRSRITAQVFVWTPPRTRCREPPRSGRSSRRSAAGTTRAPGRRCFPPRLPGCLSASADPGPSRAAPSPGERPDEPHRSPVPMAHDRDRRPRHDRGPCPVEQNPRPPRAQTRRPRRTPDRRLPDHRHRDPGSINIAYGGLIASWGDLFDNLQPAHSTSGHHQPSPTQPTLNSPSSSPHDSP